MNRRCAMSLVELLVALAIIGILLGLLLPAVQKVRSAAARSSCQNNLKQIALATHTYESVHAELPSGLTPLVSSEAYPRLGWLARLLPHVEQQPLWDATVSAFAVDRTNPLSAAHIGMRTPVSTYSCPADDRQRHAHSTRMSVRVAVSGYLGVAGKDSQTVDGVLYYRSRVRLLDILDGTSNTLLVGERPPSPDYWYGWWYVSGIRGTGDTTLGVVDFPVATDPVTASCSVGPSSFRPGRADDMCDSFHFWSLHTSGANFALCDGSVRFFPYSAAGSMSALATRAGGEVVVMPD